MRARIFGVVLVVLAMLPAAALAQEPRQDGNLFRWDGQSWQSVDGYGVRVAIGPNNEPWVVNSSHEIWRSVNGNFEKLPGEAVDIGSGGNQVWIIGTDSAVYQWNGDRWDKIQGSNGASIAVDSSGAPWVVGYDNQIYHWVNSRFVQMNGRAKDIAANGGAVWIIGTDNGIYRLQGNNWTRVQGSGERISVASDGTPWVVNQNREVYRWQNGAFERMPGSGFDVAVASQDNAWIVGGRARGRFNPNNRGFGGNDRGPARRRFPQN